jgi:hypothetical protein
MTFKIKIATSKLQTIILGGNRNVGYSTPITIRGRSTDPDLPP